MKNTIHISLALVGIMLSGCAFYELAGAQKNISEHRSEFACMRTIPDGMAEVSTFPARESVIESYKILLPAGFDAETVAQIKNSETDSTTGIIVIGRRASRLTAIEYRWDGQWVLVPGEITLAPKE